ncbi:OsmC family protein [Gramella jeungdoensis]|uniref:OsmC family protein n=1 Tax=Gramella jeungdoensis TaxID=708091 RepID=A0ABT0Z5W2_9FLAO|nr:OsmC family protein [Gramella jeungdoensis]MCM8570164.1 OsmC family protein [Gramella jeungdoensis]
MKRKGSAIWNGSLKEGNGTVSLESGVLKDAQYSFKSRFENGKGTNPEELVGAAHAGCFSMQLSAFLSEEGFEPDKIETTSEITFEDGTVKRSHLILTGTVPGIDKDKFEEIANKAKEKCPISRLLKAEITLEYDLK